MADVDPLVRWILGRRKIKNKLVVLCEGDRPPIEWNRPSSPQSYARLETMPDANFYLACVPRSWHGDRIPVFFNCGDRGKVIATYSALLETHAQDPEASFLDPEKLYALLDLDVQVAQLPPGYPWATTEAIHEALYDDGLLRPTTDDRHRIWVTALVHKEAFFVVPSAASTWMDHAGASFRGQPIDLHTFYRVIAQALATDQDVHRNLTTVQARLARFLKGRALSCTSTQALCTSWLDTYASANAGQQECLLKALVAVAKVSDLAADAHPLAGFFAWLAPRR